MKNMLFSIFILISFILSPFLPVTQNKVDYQSLPTNLSFKADIYGDEGLETIEYVSDLAFYNYGGYGTDALIYKAGLKAGDAIFYGARIDSLNVFSLNIFKNDGTRTTVSISPSSYSQGKVNAVSESERHFFWDIIDTDLHIRLHRNVYLVHDENVTVDNIIVEKFSIENLGPTIRVLRFTEDLLIDDVARIRDFNHDGLDETLLALNNYTTNGYPIFAKIYHHQGGIDAGLSSDGKFAAISHQLNYLLQKNGSIVVSEASYISSSARNEINAEMQIATDAAYILGLEKPTDQWLVRSYNTDDRGAIFLNGRMVVGSRYRHYPDSNWVSINKYWRQNEDNHLSFASYDIGACCYSTWGFSFRQNDNELWNEQSSGPTSMDIVYRHMLKMTKDNELDHYEFTKPDSTISGNWYILVRADNGMAFALIDNYPISGSTYNQEKWIDITPYLGQLDNHIHFNAWNDGGSSFSWYYAIKHNDEIVWSNQDTIVDGTRGLSHHMELVINEEGNVYPKLDYPVYYNNKTRGSSVDFEKAFNTRTYSMFDHRWPTYGENDDWFMPYYGIPVYNVGLPCTKGLVDCYDGHDGYDIVNGTTVNPFLIYPAADGRINDDETGWKVNELGCQITVEHGNGWKTVYAHLLDSKNEICAENNPCEHPCEGILQSAGQVSQYSPFGIMGCSGSNCLGNHLHFVVKHNDIVVDPSGWDSLNPDDWAIHENGTVSFHQWLYRTYERQQIDPETGGQIISVNNTTQIIVPVHYYDEALTFIMSSVPINDSFSNFASTGLSYSLRAFNGSNSPVDHLNQPFTIQIQYLENNIFGIKENTLSFYEWDKTSLDWSQIETIVVTEKNMATSTVDHLLIFALMGEPWDKIYLPIIFQYNK